MQVLSQRDSRWKYIKLGYGNTTIGDYGCTLVSLSMLAGILPPEANQRLKNVGGFTDYGNKNLIIWSKIHEAIPWLSDGVRGWGYDNNKVSGAIEQSGGCMVEVDGAIIGASKHWVLYVGDKKMNDPWFGTQKDTNYYPATGCSIITKLGEKPEEGDDNMPDTKLLTWTDTKTDDEAIAKLTEHLGEKDGKCAYGMTKDDGYLGSEREKNRVLKAENDELSDDIVVLNERLNNCVDDNVKLIKENKEYEEAIDGLNKTVIELEDENEILKKQLEDCGEQNPIDLEGWEENGLSITTDKDGVVSQVINYKRTI